MRSDAVKARRELLRSAEEVLVEGAGELTMAAVAKRSGHSVATCYRHFESLEGLKTAVHAARLQELVGTLRQILDSTPVHKLFIEICRAWVTEASAWTHALRYTRSSAGFIERVRSGESISSALFTILNSALDVLIDGHVVPEQDREVAVLLWISLFDERVLIDLHTVMGIGTEEIASILAQSMLASLRSAPTQRAHAG